MNSYRLYEEHGGWTESSFRAYYSEHLIEQSMQCCTGMPDEGQCKNQCHYLFVEGIEHVDDEGCFPIWGVDCDVEVLCWGGDDVTNSTVEAYCAQCAAASHEFRIEREIQEDLECERRSAVRARRLAEIQRVERSLSEHWNGCSGTVFEDRCAQLFRDLGFMAVLTQATNDGGIDIRLGKDKKRGAVQCKAWAKPCGVKDVREFYGVVCLEHFDFGYFISRSGFTEQANDLLRRLKIIEGWNVEALVSHAKMRKASQPVITREHRASV